VADRNVVLDTSAVLSFLCDEDGAALVESYLIKARKGGLTVYLCFATLAEVFSCSLKKESRERAELYVASINSWPAKWVHSSAELSLAAGTLKAMHKMSFADSFIAATAMHLDSALIHKDPEFDALASILPMIRLPYKHGKI
jgi:predicted nucleic acid-binding protein